MRIYGKREKYSYEAFPIKNFALKSMSLARPRVKSKDKEQYLAIYLTSLTKENQKQLSITLEVGHIINFVKRKEEPGNCAGNCSVVRDQFRWNLRRGEDGWTWKRERAWWQCHHPASSLSVFPLRTLRSPRLATAPMTSVASSPSSPSLKFQFSLSQFSSFSFYPLILGYRYSSFFWELFKSK